MSGAGGFEVQAGVFRLVARESGFSVFGSDGREITCIPVGDPKAIREEMLSFGERLERDAGSRRRIVAGGAS